MDATLKSLASSVEAETSVITEECCLRSFEKFLELRSRETGLLAQEDFAAVFRLAFTDVSEDQVLALLLNPLFMARAFDFMCRGNAGASREGLEVTAFGEGLRQMFSPDDEQQACFRFAVLDTRGEGRVGERDVAEVAQSFLEAQLARVAVEKTSVGLGGGRAGNLSRSRPAASLGQSVRAARGDLGAEKLREAVHEGFRRAGIEAELSWDEFLAAYLREPDAFNWEDITARVLEAIERVVRRRAF